MLHVKIRMHDETCLRLDFFERLNISDANWAVSDKQEAPHFCRVPAEKVDGKTVPWSGCYVETKKQQSCSVVVEGW